jgi:hypothetical protein
MQDLGARNPAVYQPLEPVPRHLVPLAPTAECAVPPPDDLSPKAVQTIHVAGNRVIVEVALYNGPQPPPDVDDRRVPASPKLLLQLCELGGEAFADGLAFDDESAGLPGFPTQVCEAQKVECLRLVLAALLSVDGCVAPECNPISATVRAAPSRTAGWVVVPSKSASASTARPVNAGMRRMAAWKVAWRAASYSAWNAASSVSQRCSVRSPMRHRAAAWPIVGSDRSATIACSRTAAVFAPWPAPDFLPSAATCCHLGGLGRLSVTDMRCGACGPRSGTRGRARGSVSHPRRGGTSFQIVRSHVVVVGHADE